MLKRNLVLILFVGILLVGTMSALEQTYCCEKTTSGAWCQNAAESKCDDNYQMAATSCESTGYCRLGCCYDSQEGTCMENTPEVVCGGIWEDSADCDIPQCSLGCCLIGDQAAFSTQTRCKALSSLYGLEVNFRSDITNELTCIATATADVKGACVYEEEYQKTCDFVTRSECTAKSAVVETEFYEGLLCSAESLGTNCVPTEKTTCVEGEDRVYYVDSCGNLANVYDSNKIASKDRAYWNEIADDFEICGADDQFGNADSTTCGNCDYYSGSTCKEAGIGSGVVYGDNICADLSCEFEGETYQHGETWCWNSEGAKANLPGSRYFRLVCYNSEVTVEPCADFRQEICKETEVNAGFTNAACVVNKWQDCTSQESESNCMNEDKRDCVWLDNSNSCVPKYAPGFDFWENEGICESASESYTIKYEKSLFGDWECVENCEYCQNGEDKTGCTGDNLVDELNNACKKMGDCGGSVNYIGKSGYNSKNTLNVVEQA